MKFIAFTTKDKENTRLGVYKNSESIVIDLNTIGLSRFFHDMNDLIKNIKPKDIDVLKEVISLVEEKEYETYHVEEITLGAPIDRTIHDVICVGLNYAEHIDETKKGFDENMEIPLHTVYFSKRANQVKGPGEEIESHSHLNESMDYEVELAVIIGKEGINISKEEAKEYIFGYTILNDLSARGLQKNHVQWFRGKSLDGFTSMGPCIVHGSSVGFPLELDIKSRVNDELRQNSNTKFMMKDVSTIISEISQGMTLLPGDVIATGTPSGVGMGFTPPRFLKAGDTVECEIQHMGLLKNKIK
ncbi:fumarylacetoacetate (FAA) hydrolase [Alkaliphilus metalliredigens QYMF]|uniref:Fumarylacetoacetate (FAA) hydrolase n=1 Tax=Alkaliphilus metalliredigens (strain QYMF) TaxID=293826 RepID=A6TKL2_ALKMQ|nr:fumarylacetoacetate hydrolase family protein [Alkaliphilus metalliredigens]ABR46730.1 fumarylacetoacetate (FAA) hydrolase [Alkaliphilus metalliredigens QYMF]